VNQKFKCGDLVRLNDNAIKWMMPYGLDDLFLVIEVISSASGWNEDGSGEGVKIVDVKGKEYPKSEHTFMSVRDLILVSEANDD